MANLLIVATVFAAWTLVDSISIDEWREQLQPLLDEASQRYGSAYAMGLVAPNISIGLAAGDIDTIDAKHGSPASVSDGFVWGSVTKTFTGAGILQLVAAGKLKLDDRAETYVDPMLKLARAPYQSMQEYFRADRWSIPPSTEYNASNITIRHLLNMVSGIRDYDTSAYRDFQYESPTLDTSPLQILDWVHGPLMFKPGGPTPDLHPGNKTMNFNYCSVNYILLGYVLAHFAGADHWANYDQRSVVPSALRTRMPGLKFAKAGACSHYTRVHGYDQASAYAPYDVSNTSCLGGWTAGNIVMPALTAAEWARGLWSLKNSEVLPTNLVRDMITFPNGSFYGLATMNMTYVTGLSFLGDYGLAVGHLGDTYGYTSMLTYFPKLDVGLAIATNHEGRMQGGPRALMCTVYNRALDIMLKQKPRNCTYVNGSYYRSGCKCDQERSEVELVV